jgi:RNA polymerase sigma factor (sigma-70 family)
MTAGGTEDETEPIFEYRCALRCNAEAYAGHVWAMKRDAAVSDVPPRKLAAARISDLYRDHARELLGYALRRSADRDDAADVVAETFLIAWRRIGEVPLDDEARLWLYGTARHVLANQDRGARRRDRLRDVLRDELRQHVQVQQALEGSAFLKALAGLGESDRELLMLIGWEELTPTQAAQALGISPLAARTRLHRARRRLRAQLAEQPSEGSPNTEIEVEEAR